MYRRGHNEVSGYGMPLRWEGRGEKENQEGVRIRGCRDGCKLDLSYRDGIRTPYKIRPVVCKRGIYCYVHYYSDHDGKIINVWIFIIDLVNSDLDS